MEALWGWHTWVHKQALPLAHARTHTHTPVLRAGSQAQPSQPLPLPPSPPTRTLSSPAWFYSILTTSSVGALLGVLEVGGSQPCQTEPTQGLHSRSPGHTSELQQVPVQDLFTSQ